MLIPEFSTREARRLEFSLIEIEKIMGTEVLRENPDFGFRRVKFQMPFRRLGDCI